MSSATSGSTPFAPGFEFLQNLMKNAGTAMPGIGQWVAPTLDPAELDKRIQELRTVQFWLEQNAKLLATTIQALEVQRMTLSTLKTMNVQMGDLREALLIKPAAGAAKKAEAQTGSGGKAVDPMQWWNALTTQFSELAANAMKDGASSLAQVAAPRNAPPAAAKPASRRRAPAKG